MEPYRLFFPLGALYAIAGALLWLGAALGIGGYPAELHRLLMIQGFEQSFIVGFLLTALPGLTRSRRADPAETFTAFGALVLVGVFALAGWIAAAYAVFTASLLVVATAAVRRMRDARAAPPEEFLFVGLGLAFGVTGGALLALGAAGVPLGLPAAFAGRLVSLGMVLTLVLGVGSLLVPTFMGMANPLVIPRIAGPHERPSRRAFYAIVAAALVAAFVFEALQVPAAGAYLRALAVSALLLLVWKLPRGAGRGDRSAWSMWSAGACVLAGAWTAALLPAYTLAGLHLMFVGGFGLLTLAIGTRVVIAHGRHGFQAEARVLTRGAVVLVALALATRIAADAVPAHGRLLLAASGALWAAAWLRWIALAAPRIRAVNVPPDVIRGPGAPSPARRAG